MLVPGGIPMLVRPGKVGLSRQKVEPIDPKDPLAQEKTRLRDWEKSLNLQRIPLPEGFAHWRSARNWSASKSGPLRAGRRRLKGGRRP